MKCPGNPWFVARTLSNREKVVAAHLGSRLVEYYLPTYKRTSNCCDRRVILDSPLFPGYLFVRFTRHQQLTVITVPGILCILDAPGGLASVADEEILRLQEGLSQRLKILPTSFYSAGDQVRLLEGPFQGYLAKVAETTSRNLRLVLSVGSLGTCCFSLEVNPAEVELLAPPTSRMLPGVNKGIPLEQPNASLSHPRTLGQSCYSGNEDSRAGFDAMNLSFLFPSTSKGF
jgi:transcriptional antiterminator NusG